MAKFRFWRARFSLRTMLVLVTMVCLYLGCWELTQRYGVPKRKKYLEPPVESPLPFVLVNTKSRVCGGGGCYREVQVWLFGSVWETPIQWEVDLGP